MPDEECEKLKADKSKDGIAVVDAASRKVSRVLPGGSDPETFDISQDGATLFVSNEDAGTASIVDIASGKIRSTVTVGKEPEGVRVHPDGKTVWVTGETDAQRHDRRHEERRGASARSRSGSGRGRSRSPRTARRPT